MTNQLIKGIHHVTATTDNALEDYHFYTHVLGMRLVKKTVNFDNNHVYHFYYADKIGTPGTIFTTFPYKKQPNVKVGVEGTGQIIATALSVPIASLSFWHKRLQNAGTLVTYSQRFKQPVLWFRDPSGLQIELIGENNDARKPWTNAENPEITEGVAIRGIHHVTISVAPENWDLMGDFLQLELNMRRLMEENNRIRFGIGDGGAGNYLELQLNPHAPIGRNGIGTVHHVALKVGNEEALLAMQARLIEIGLKPTELRDRKYFRSVYFRPFPTATMWFELATITPGFGVDEAEEELGTHLLLPEWEEVNRAEIEAVLPKI